MTHSVYAYIIYLYAIISDAHFGSKSACKSWSRHSLL